MKPNRFSLDSYLGYVLGSLGEQASRLCERRYARYGISVTQWRVIALLAEHPNATHGLIARLAIMDKPRITRAVTSLLAQGLIVRKMDPGDNRKIRLNLTGKGQVLLHKIQPFVVEVQNILESALTRAELEMLGVITAKLAKAIAAANARYAPTGALDEERD